MKKLRFLPPWLLAALLTTLGMSLVHSLMVQQGLIDLGVAMPMDVRMQTAARDFVGLLPTLGAVVAIGFALAFAVAGALRRFAPGLAFPLAGGVAIAAALMLMKLQFEMTPIAGARTQEGLWLMVLAGVLGGWLFGRLARFR